MAKDRADVVPHLPEGSVKQGNIAAVGRHRTGEVIHLGGKQSNHVQDIRAVSGGNILIAGAHKGRDDLLTAGPRGRDGDVRSSNTFGIICISANTEHIEAHLIAVGLQICQLVIRQLDICGQNGPIQNQRFSILVDVFALFIPHESLVGCVKGACKLDCQGIQDFLIVGNSTLAGSVFINLCNGICGGILPSFRQQLPLRLEGAVKVIVIQRHGRRGCFGINLFIVLISRLCKNRNGCDIRIRVGHGCSLAAAGVVISLRNCLQATFFHGIQEPAIGVPQFRDGQIKVGAVNELR